MFIDINHLIRAFGYWGEFISIFLRVLPFNTKTYVVLLVDAFRLLPQTCVVLLLVSGWCFVNPVLCLLHGMLKSTIPFKVEVSLCFSCEGMGLSAIGPSGLEIARSNSSKLVVVWLEIVRVS